MGTASAASAQLSDLVTRGADASALRAAASQLDDQLARLVADSGNNPDATALAVLMLQRSARVLAASGQRAALGDVLERNRQLELQWRAGLPAAAPQQPATDGTAGPGGATPLPASPQPGAVPPAETNPSAQPSPGAGILTSAAPRPASPTPLPASAPSAVTAPGVRLPPMTG